MLSPGRWRNMDVAIKVILHQDTALAVEPDDTNLLEAGHHKIKAMARKLVVKEAAVCSSMSHPNVVATYHFEVMRASHLQHHPGLRITDKSGEEAFKVYLIQVSTYVSCSMRYEVYLKSASDG